MNAISIHFYTFIRLVCVIFFKEINSLIQQGSIKLIKGESKDGYNVKQLFLF